MERLEINIVIETNIVQDTRKIIPNTVITNDIVIEGVIELSTVEDVDNMTDTATVVLPLQKFFINNEGLFYPISGSDTSMYYIFPEARIAIYLNYDSTQKRQVFRGYIKDYDTTENTITLNVEDNFRFLKLQPKIKASFDNVIKEGDIPDDLYVGETFELKHLVYWIFKNKEYSNIVFKNFLEVVQPYTHIYVMEGLTLDRLIIFNKLLPSLILDKLNDIETYYFRTFVRYENYVEQIIGGGDETYLRPETNLYIGHKNWLGKTAYDVKTDLYNKRKSDPLVIGRDTKHSYLHKFAYPFLKGQNVILDHDLKFEDTGKKDLVVIVITEDENGNVPPYTYYPADSPQAVELQTRQITNDAQLNDPTTKKEYEALTDKDYVQLIAEEKNTIRIKVPGLSPDAAKELAQYRYDNYQDSGYFGSFTTLGEPYVQKGDVVQLTVAMHDNIKNDYDIDTFSYFVASVERFVNDEGYIQKITIGNRYFAQ